MVLRRLIDHPAYRELGHCQYRSISMISSLCSSACEYKMYRPSGDTDIPSSKSFSNVKTSFALCEARSKYRIVLGASFGTKENPPVTSCQSVHCSNRGVASV